MKLAYIISVYKYPEQLIRLIERLNTDSTSFFVHVDKKTDEQIYLQMANALIHLPNVQFLKRHPCDWGGFGHVAATLEGICEILRNRIDFDYAILLTGQDYPIQSNDHIHQFLQDHQENLFLEYFPLPHDEWQNCGMDRIGAWHWRAFNRHFKISPGHPFPIKRRFPKGFEPFGGSSYWCLTRECIEYIHACTKENPAFVNFFRFVDVPDELFFQTIILNSPFKHKAINDNLRYMEWNDPSSGSPAILGKNDLQKLLASSKLFARKFDISVDAKVLDLIDRQILAIV